jgi:hypothetical protein
VERQRNAVLRPLDWRFLLDRVERPRAAILTKRRNSEGLRLVFAPEDPARRPNLVVGGFPSAALGARAIGMLAHGGEIACSWRLPRPTGVRRALRRLERAGFDDVRAYWSGPLPFRQPQFWLRLDDRAATEHLLAARPARSPLGRLLRRIWALAARSGLLAPVCVIGRKPGSAVEGPAGGDPPTGGRPGTLLTGGRRSINKVVGLAFDRGSSTPARVVKVARVEEAEDGLAREAAVLRALGESRANLGGIPRLLGEGRRGGMLAVEESTIEGASLLDSLSPENLAERATSVTDLLIELAGEPSPSPEGEWRERLVDDPLRRFEREFGPALSQGAAEAAARLLDRIGDMPLVPEHRDCSPWNVVLAGGGPALLDWESAEPSGLPGLDLVYFLANSAFVLDGALDSGRTRESYASLLDRGTRQGRVAAEACERYAAAVGIDVEAFPRLRLLCWIVHSRSDYRHLALETAGAPVRGALRASTFLGLIEEELARAAGGGHRE